MPPPRRARVAGSVLVASEGGAAPAGAAAAVPPALHCSTKALSVMPLAWFSALLARHSARHELADRCEVAAAAGPSDNTAKAEHRTAIWIDLIAAAPLGKKLPASGEEPDHPALSHFFMKLVLAAPASGLPSLPTACSVQDVLMHFFMKLVLAAPASGFPCLSIAFASHAAFCATACASVTPFAKTNTSIAKAICLMAVSNGSC